MNCGVWSRDGKGEKEEPLVSHDLGEGREGKRKAWRGTRNERLSSRETRMENEKF